MKVPFYFLHVCRRWSLAIAARKPLGSHGRERDHRRDHLKPEGDMERRSPNETKRKSNPRPANAKRRMPVKAKRISNAEIARLFTRFADLLEIEEANPFRVRAYRNAARAVETWPNDLSDLVTRGESLRALPGVGADLGGKIAEIVQTGELRALKDLQKTIPSGLPELMKVSSLGPKRIHRLYHELGVTDFKSLKQALQNRRVRKLSGFGAKTEEKLFAEVERFENSPGRRWRLAEVEPVVERLVANLKQVPGVERVVVAGSYRRRQETIGDIDLLVTTRRTTKAAPKVMDAFVRFDDVDQIVSQGEKKTTVLLRSGLQVDVRIIAPSSFGAALYYFTGSKSHNIAVRTRAVERGLKINEYGVFKGQKKLAGLTEEDVFASVGLPYIVPELRENRGEIHAAEKGELPNLIEIEDLKGDLHAHTLASDGRNTAEQMAEAAAQRGYEYLAITDHSPSLKVAHGLDEHRLMAQLDAIDRINEKLAGRIVILKAAEVDILQDGKLDYPDSVLKRLDLRVGSIHSRFGLSREEQTERLLRALENPYLDILGHPSGRLIGTRAPYEFDLERVLKVAAEYGCCVELNSQPERLDLSDTAVRLAKDLGVKVAISSDAHSVEGLGFIRYGVAQARRGWLEARDVINTLSLKAFQKALRR